MEKYEDIEELEGFKKMPLGRSLDLRGQTYGKLIPLYRTETNNPRKAYWLCQCTCEENKYTIVQSTKIKSGHTKSCGCYAKEKTSERSFNDLTGLKFGHLTVLERGPDYVSPGGKKLVKWVCQCDCKNQTIVQVLAVYLTRGHTTSCGCLKESKGVFSIKKIFKNNNIKYDIEKTFSQCKDKRVLPFDFYYEKNQKKIVIEFDGEQHFVYKNNNGWCNQKNYERTRKHDLIKNKYCFDNNITLIRIPYTHYDDLCLEDLLPETSKFILTPENEAVYYKLFEEK